MGASRASKEVLQVATGWQAVEIVLKCFFIGIWQLLQICVKRFWKGHIRNPRRISQIELTEDSAVGRHCYIKVLCVKYHYVETGPKTGQKVIVLGDAPETVNLWGPIWSNVVKQLADTNHHIITLDLRGTGASEGGSRSELSPPRAVEELSTLMSALGITNDKPAIVIGFGIGGMLTWYLAHCHPGLISKFCVVGAPHPDLYWQYPPADFCQNALHFIQWPYFPERWLAEGALEGSEGRWASSRAQDWLGALNYVRGAAWWSVGARGRLAAPALLVGGAGGAAALVASAARCKSATLRLVHAPSAADPQLPNVLLDFLQPKELLEEKETLPRAGIMGLLGAVAGRGRELTQRYVLPTHA